LRNRRNSFFNNAQILKFNTIIINGFRASQFHWNIKEVIQKKILVKLQQVPFLFSRKLKIVYRNLASV
jgi:hypothetical protein